MNEPHTGRTSPAFLTSGQVAAELQINPGVARRYMRDGVIPAFRVGTTGPWRTTRDALDKYAADSMGLKPAVTSKTVRDNRKSKAA